MVAKTKAKREMTKAQLIQAIASKVKRADPMIRDDLIRGLKYKDKATLVRYLSKVRVDSGGNGIRLG